MPLSRSCHVRLLLAGVGCAAALAGCSQGAPDPAATPSRQPLHAEQETGLFAGALSDCAGFTAADAARILGVPAERIALQPDANATESLQLCNFPDAEDWRGGMSFYLSREETVEQAQATMARGHGLATTAQDRIERIVDTQSADAPLRIVRGLGDDVAYRIAVNDALTLRVNNIIVTVMGGDLEQQKQAAAIVVEGLRAH